MTSTITTLDAQDQLVLRMLLEKASVNPVSARERGIDTEDLDQRMERLMDLGLDFERTNTSLISGFGGTLHCYSYRLHNDSLSRARQLYEQSVGGGYISPRASKLLREALRGFSVNERVAVFKLNLAPASLLLLINELEEAGLRFDREDSRPGMGLERMEMPRFTLQTSSRGLAEKLLKANEGG